MNQPPSNPSYVADDAKITTASLEFLRTEAGATLLQEVRRRMAANPSPAVADVAALRKHYDAGAVHAALAILKMQQKAGTKFPRLPMVWGVPEALEQATDEVVARHKARRYAAAGVTEVWDLCAGIGGDSMSLAEIAPVTAVDLSAARMSCLQWNVKAAKPRFPVKILVGDVRTEVPVAPPTGAGFHIDPSRRTAGNRSARYEDLIPGPTVLEDLMARFSGGGLKLSSAVEFENLPPGHLELISHRRVVVQAVLWTGRLATTFARGSRTATVVQEGGPAFEFSAEPEAVTPVPAESLDLTAGVLYEADGSLTRAGVAGAFARREKLDALTTDGGYLWGAARDEHPALVGFAVEKIVPFSEQRVASKLREMGGAAGVVEVKTRGGLPGVETDDLQRRLTKAAPYRRTVLVFRNGKDVLAAIGQRVR